MRVRVNPLSVTLTVMVFCMLWVPGVHAQHKVAFITSVSGNGNLGDATEWPDNGGLTGVAAADRVCQNRAEAANLPNPGDFVAWLSSSVDDAYCRVHNLGGKKTTNCGQAGLPAWAGPWVRVDGAPFAETIDQALMPSGLVYRFVGLDEFGAPLDAYSQYFTGTDEYGAHYYGCSDWSGTTGTATTGSSSGTINEWSISGGRDCSDSASLLCLEARGPGPSLDHTQEAGAIVFVTSVSGAGDLGSWPEAGTSTGLAAGDAICQTLAENAGLPEPDSFVALLSDSFTDAIDRITGVGPWVRLDGVTVAVDKADLFDGTLRSSIHVTNDYQYENRWVFTGTWSNGTGAPGTCFDWTDGASANAIIGVTGYTHHGWTETFDASCSTPSRLYCISNSNSWPFFSDRFESGDLRWWAAVEPN